MKLFRKMGLLELLFCIWLIGAQAWYYLQFAGLFENSWKPLLRGVWR